MYRSVRIHHWAIFKKYLEKAALWFFRYSSVSDYFLSFYELPDADSLQFEIYSSVECHLLK